MTCSVPDFRGDPLADESGRQLTQAINCAPLGQRFRNADKLCNPEAIVLVPPRHLQIQFHSPEQGSWYVLPSLVSHPRTRLTYIR